MGIFERGDRDPSDRRPDWVHFQELEELLREDVDEAWARDEQERSEQLVRSIEEDTDDDVDC